MKHSGNERHLHGNTLEVENAIISAPGLWIFSIIQAEELFLKYNNNNSNIPHSLPSNPRGLFSPNLKEAHWTWFRLNRIFSIPSFRWRYSSVWCNNGHIHTDTSETLPQVQEKYWPILQYACAGASDFRKPTFFPVWVKTKAWTFPKPLHFGRSFVDWRGFSVS